MKRIIALAALILILVTGCAPISVPVTGITLNGDAADLVVGETLQLLAAIAPDDATNQELLWSSDSPEIADVSSSGLVTAKGNGSALISVSSADGNASAEFIVHVTTPVEGVALDLDALGLEVNGAGQLRAIISPANASNQEVNWSSDNTDVAAVDETGRVTARGNGAAVITARSADGGFSAQAAITVTTAVTGISLDKTSLSLETGGKAKLTAQISPITASDKGLTWSSNNTQIATVDSQGTVTAIGPGAAVVSAVTRDGGKRAEAAVTVLPPPKATTADEELRMIALVNQERQKAGLPSLTLNPDLIQVARIKSQDMLDNDYFDHFSPVYGNPDDMMRHFGIAFNVAGENLAWGYRSITTAHQALMDSDGHRANILHPELSEIGIGIIETSRGYYYITQMFIGF